MVIFKQKVFSSEKKDRKEIGKKVALGVGGTALAAAAAFKGAKSGMFGNKLARKANEALSETGVKFANKGMNRIGERMIYSGSTGLGEIERRKVAKELTSMGLGATAESRAAKQAEVIAKEKQKQYLNRINRK